MPETSSSFVQLLPLLVFFALMYFMMIRPQQKQARERKAMLEGLKKNDKVVTVGGIHGVITDLDENTVTLRIADKVEVTLNRNAVGTVLSK